MTECEEVCTSCGKRQVREDLTAVEGGAYQCERCQEDIEYDRLIPERQQSDDDSPTTPMGDPGEAGHPMDDKDGEGRSDAA